MEEKEKLYAHCLNYVQQRIDRIQQEITLAQQSANSDTKSSMGDKYETSREMASQEIERNMVQLAEAEKLKGALLAISSHANPGVITPGSLVTTSNGKYYLAISIGVVKINQQDYFILSPDSPIGKQLMGQPVGSMITWNSKSFQVLKIE